MSKKHRMFVFLGLSIIVAGTLVFATTDNPGPGNKQRKAETEEREGKGRVPGFMREVPLEISEDKFPTKPTGYTHVTVRQVTTSSNDDRQPSWSPDGQEIVFVSEPTSGGGASCYKINQDGTGLALLGPGYAEFGNNACYHKPSFSPDGSKILYSLFDSTLVSSWKPWGFGAIWMMNSDGSGKQRVSPFDTTIFSCRSKPGASWSKDGNTVYYRNLGDGDLYSCQVGTGIEVNLTSCFSGIHGCCWTYSVPKVSPDGEWILFRNWNLDPVKVDTTGMTYIEIDDSHGNGRRQDWSPDGSKIVYEEDRMWSGYMGLWIANSSGTGQAPFLQSDTVCFLRPAWSPDGKWIAYLRRSWDMFGTCTTDVWVTSTDGLYQGNLSCQIDTIWRCRSTPEWNAAGDRIVFDARNNMSDMDIYVIDLDTGDNDTDMLLNWEEEVAYGTDPNDNDTDGGGEHDGREIVNGRDPLNPFDDFGILPSPEILHPGWNSIALPLIPPDPDPNVCFGDDVSPVTMYGYDETTNSYYEPSALMMGKGYLLGSWAAGCTLDVTGTPVTLPYDITGLTKNSPSSYSGLNLIGNPTNDTINFDDFILDNVYLMYTYFNGYQNVFFPGGGASSGIPQWMGFWVHVINPGFASVTVPFTVKGEDTPITYDFRIRLGVKSGDMRDEHNYISVTNDARACDIVEINLPLSEYVMLYFPEEEAGYQQRVFREIDGTMEIPVELEVNTDNPVVTLSWEVSGELSGYDITLTDGNTVIDMTDEDSYTFENNFGPEAFTEPEFSEPAVLLSRKASGEIRYFTLRLSPTMAVDVMPQGRTYLKSILPNPAADYTDIAFSLVRKGEVKVNVYDAGGRYIQTIATGTYSEGIHSMRWDTSELNPGAYFVKFDTPGYTETKKVVIVK